MDLSSLLEHPVIVRQKLRDYVIKFPNTASHYSQEIGISRLTFQRVVGYSESTMISLKTLLKIINFLSRVS